MNKHLLLLVMLFITITGFAQNPCGKAYVRGNNPPWGQTTNEQAMDLAFGAGGWDNLTYGGVNAATLFSPTYGVVVLEGGDGTANELEAFLTANLPAIEAWVFAGNALMINAAPNQGNGMNYGFGGVSLTYPSFVPNASSPNPGHPIFAGPALPVTTAYTGNFYGHAVICPPALPATVLMANQANANAHVAVEADWGAGYVIFGGMTTTNWHSPNPQALNLRANMFSYMESQGCGAAPPGGGDCYNNPCVTVVCPPDVTVQCIEDFTPNALDATATTICGMGGGGGPMPTLCAPYTVDATLANNFTSIAIPANFVGNGDDTTFDVPLGAPYPLYGTPVNTLQASTNGWLTNNLTAGSDLGNSCPYPDPSTTGEVLGVLHDDLDMDPATANSGIYYQYFAVSPVAHPNGAVVGASIFEWNGEHFPGGAGGIDVVFQAVLFDNGDVIYQYAQDPENGSGSTIGAFSTTCQSSTTAACNTGGTSVGQGAWGLSAYGGPLANTPAGGGGAGIIGQWVTQPHQTGADNCDGTTYVFTYKAADSEGNIGCCDQIVTIANAAPTISVIPGTTVECAADIVTDPSDATVTTSCGEVLDVTIYAPTVTGTANCPNTTYTYTYRVEDQCEREATATRTFTVQNAGPTIVAPANTTCECRAGITPNGANASVDTSCDLGFGVTTTIANGNNVPQDCPGATYVVTYTATDDCNRPASANQTFTLQNGPPVFLNAPANCLILNCEDEGWENIIQAWLASVKATNSCGTPLTVLNNYNPNNQGVCISNGTTVVTWRTTDQCFRTTTVSSMIIINDTEPPVFTTPAQNELDICNYGTQAEFAAWVAAHGNAVAVDGCDQNITNNQWSTIPNNPQFPNCINNMGPTSMSVTFVVRDDCGNKSSSTATFTALMTGADMVEQGDGIAETANEFELYQNQPNPFSNETLIGFSLPKAGAATLTIYDISGKVVKLVEGDFSEGYNEVQITRNELNSAGMLYYELNTADKTAVKKMIIID